MKSEIEFVKITGGEFEFKGVQVYVRDFEIGKYPVDNYQYNEFITSKDCEVEKPKHWEKDGLPPPKKDAHPVVNVSWHAAMAYCEWLSKKLGKNVTLPNEAQWEYAAGGKEKRTYPWGEKEPNETLCNFNNNVGDTTSVHKYHCVGTPEGVYDMAGNVWEWCLDKDEDCRVLRGGAFDDGPNDVRVAARLGLNPDIWDYDLGFRVVVPPLHSLDDETMNDVDKALKILTELIANRLRQKEILLEQLEEKEREYDALTKAYKILEQDLK